MFYQAKKLRGTRLHATDGRIGEIDDFYFDDQHWAVRYIVADTGKRLTGREVLISPYSVINYDEEDNSLNVDLSMARIENSPPIDSHKPVSRQYEEKYYGYYGWPMYWTGPFMWGPVSRPSYHRIARSERQETNEKHDPHLRSVNHVTGYEIQGRDGNVGHVEDFVISDEDWAIRYLIVDTMNWWPGKKIVLPPQWITDINWRDRHVAVDLDRTTIKEAPEFDERRGITRYFEEQLFKYYGREGYWMQAEHALDGR